VGEGGGRRGRGFRLVTTFWVHSLVSRMLSYVVDLKKREGFWWTLAEGLLVVYPGEGGLCWCRCDVCVR
jgi:hypothetical protein